MTKIQKQLGENLKIYRKLFGLNQMELAERANISTGFLASIETGKKFPSPRTLEALSDSLNVEPYQLFIDESSAANDPGSDFLRFSKEIHERISQVIMTQVYEYGQKQKGRETLDHAAESTRGLKPKPLDS